MSAALHVAAVERLGEVPLALERHVVAALAQQRAPASAMPGRQLGLVAALGPEPQHAAGERARHAAARHLAAQRQPRRGPQHVRHVLRVGKQVALGQRQRHAVARRIGAGEHARAARRAHRGGDEGAREVMPVRRSSASLGISASSQPGSAGQCWGARCWSVISRIRFGGRGAGLQRSSPATRRTCLDVLDPVLAPEQLAAGTRTPARPSGRGSPSASVFGVAPRARSVGSPRAASHSAQSRPARSHTGRSPGSPATSTASAQMPRLASSTNARSRPTSRACSPTSRQRLAPSPIGSWMRPNGIPRRLRLARDVAHRVQPLGPRHGLAAHRHRDHAAVDDVDVEARRRARRRAARRGTSTGCGTRRRTRARGAHAAAAPAELVEPLADLREPLVGEEPLPVDPGRRNVVDRRGVRMRLLVAATRRAARPRSRGAAPTAARHSVALGRPRLTRARRRLEPQRLHAPRRRSGVSAGPCGADGDPARRGRRSSPAPAARSARA